MNYVKYFNILGVNTVQIPCIELQGVPNTATEGAVGLLGINMLSEEHELYKCVEVKGGIYTWMPIKNGKDGVSIVKTELNENCELIITFSNGTQTNLGVIRGEKGEKGEQADLSKIKEKNKGRYVGFWLGDTETFEKLESIEENVWYLFEDDTTLDEIEKAFDEIDGEIGKLNTTANDLEHRTKAVEDIIPLIEDDISEISNELRESMRYIHISYGQKVIVAGNSVTYTFELFRGDVVSKPSSLSYQDMLYDYFKTYGEEIQYTALSDNSVIFDESGKNMITTNEYRSGRYWVTRDGSMIYLMKCRCRDSNNAWQDTEKLVVEFSGNYYCISVTELEME